jgi:pimeloyl-ACP methyl ester carboxylesterase
MSGFVRGARALACLALPLLLVAPPAFAIKAKTVEVNGARLAYVEHGQGPPVVLVHGALLDYRYWSPQLDALSHDYRVIAVSLRRHYPNSAPPDSSGYSPAIHAADLAALMRKLDLPPVHLVGHSYGGRVALQLAGDHPEMVRSLVLEEPGQLANLVTDSAAKAELAPLLAARTLTVKSALAKLDSGDAEGGMREFVANAMGPGVYDTGSKEFRGFLRSNVGTLRPLLTTPPARFTCEDAGKIQAPTLLIGGDASPRIYALSMTALRPCLRDAERVTLPGATHCAHWDDADAFNRAVLDFLKRH